jgi:hypothetical protein
VLDPRYLKVGMKANFGEPAQRRFPENARTSRPLENSQIAACSRSRPLFRRFATMLATPPRSRR